jgi:hypothetical protein
LRRLFAVGRADDLFTAAGPAEIERSKDGRVQTMRIATRIRRTLKSSASLLTLRGMLVPASLGAVPGAQYVVGGDLGRSIDCSRHSSEKLPLSIGFRVRSMVISISTVARRRGASAVARAPAPVAKPDVRPGGRL